MFRTFFYAIGMFVVGLLSVFKNGPPRPLLSFIFGLFKQPSLQILQQINVKNVHPAQGAGIRTHKLRNICLLP